MLVDFNWNSEQYQGLSNTARIPSEPTLEQAGSVIIRSEDLRDGLHGSHASPDPEKIFRYIDVLYILGVRHMTVGIYSGEGSSLNNKTEKILKYLYEKYPDVYPCILSVATEHSLLWASRCNEINPKLETLIFIGSSPSRMIAEGWEIPNVLDRMHATFGRANKLGLTIIGATEHTTQTPPKILENIITAQVQGAGKRMKSFCIADTIGIARPLGTYRLIQFTKNILLKCKRKDIDIEWHGHEDMGNGLANTMVSIAAGARYVHTVAYGIGERAGNVKLEGVLVNLTAILEEAGKRAPWNLQNLNHVLESYCDLVGLPVPSIGMMGTNAFRTSLGIHTAAMLKLRKLADMTADTESKNELVHMSNTVYSSIHPEAVGRKSNIRISPHSGKSTVELYFHLHKLDMSRLTDKIALTILVKAKEKGTELSYEEIVDIIED